MRTNANTVLITGGSAGIGLAIAKRLAAGGNTVIVCGRDESRLEQARIAVPGLHTIRCDLSRTDELISLRDRMTRDFPGLNVLINNAAMMRIYDFCESPGVPEQIEAELRTNLLAPMQLTSLLLPLLQAQEQAAIVIVSSGLAYVPVSNVAVYCATKAALHSFAQSLRARLRRTPIKVFELLPPLVDTELARTLRMPKLQPDDVARALLHGLARDHYEIRVGMVKSLHIASKLMPSLAQRLLNTAFSR